MLQGLGDCRHRAMAVELAPFGIRVVATIPSLSHSACLAAGG
jgi:hypothetical protein